VTLLGALLRYDFLAANQFVIDADEAIVGLMGLHISQGAPWPVFYYGQHYMGSLEPLLVAGVFRLFGVSSQSLAVVPFAFALALIPLTYLLARYVCGRGGALVAATLIALPPTGLVVWSTKARGGFIEVVVLGTLALLLTARWLKRERPSLFGTCLIGFVLGIGWWVNNQIIYFMLPIGFVLLGELLHDEYAQYSRVVRVVQHGMSGLFAFLIGGLPFWWYNFTHEFASFGMFKRASSGDVLSYVGGLFSTALPMLFGAKRFWQAEDVFPGATALAYTLYGLMVLSYLVLRARHIAGLSVLKVDTKKPLELFSLFVLGSLCTFVFSSFGWLYEAPRYLLPLYVGLFILVGFVLEQWYQRMRGVGIISFAILLGLSLSSSYLGGRAIPGEPLVHQGERVAKDHTELLNWLTQNKVSWIRTNYWIGYRVAFETQESVRFLTYQDPQYERIESYRQETSAFDPSSFPLVLVPSQGEAVSRALTLMGYQFHAERLSGYDVISEIQPSQRNLLPVSREAFSAESNPQKLAASLAVDGSVATRWGTGEPQRPGQEFTLRLTKPLPLRAIAFEMAAWPHDFARGLSIELELPSGERRPLFDPEGWGPIRYYIERTTRFDFLFPATEVQAVHFKQLGSDPIFDWTLAEVWLYQ
jgi:hypothetical protein